MEEEHCKIKTSRKKAKQLHTCSLCGKSFRNKGNFNKVQGSLLFVTYTIIQGIIGSEMLVGTGPLNGKCKKEK